MLAQRFNILFVVIVCAIFSHGACCALEKRISTESQSQPSINSFQDLEQIFTPREVEVEILGMNPSEELTRLQTAFIQSIRNNQSWFQEYLKANAERGPLPYHENFGLTKDEYERLDELTKQLKLVPVAKGRLRFSKDSDDQVLIEGVDGLQEFDGTVIDFKQERVVTRWGTAPFDHIVHADENSALGSWDGIRCRLDTGSPEEGTASLIRIDIGRQAATSLNVFVLSVRVFENGKKTASVEAPVRFP